MPPSRTENELNQPQRMRPSYKPATTLGAGEHEAIRNYIPNWTTFQQLCAQLLQCIMSKCGTTNNIVEMGQSERLRQAYVDAYAYMVHTLSEDAIQGKRPEVDEMPHAFAILYFALSKSVKLVQANGDVVVCKFVKTDNFQPLDPSIPLAPPGDADVDSGFRLVGPYAPSNDLDTLRNGFRIVTQRAKNVFTMWHEGQDPPKEIQTGSQFCWFVGGDDTGHLKGYNGLIESEFPILPDPRAPVGITKDVGLAHCCLALGTQDYVALYSHRTYVHPAAAYGWLALAGQGRMMDHFPMPIYLDAAEVVSFAAAVFEGVDQQYAETGQPNTNIFHQTAVVGGNTYFAAYVLRVLAMAFQEYQGMCFPSFLQGTTFRTIAQGSQNLPRDITSQAQDQFYKVVVELCRSLYATRHNHAFGVAHYIPICLVPEGLEEIVGAFTSWTTLPNAGQINLSSMTKVSNGQRVSFWEPFEGDYRDFVEAWLMAVSRYQNYISFAPVTNQKEIFRRLGQFFRMKSVRLPIASGKFEGGRSFGLAAFEARNRFRKVKGQPQLTPPENAVWAMPGVRHHSDADVLNNCLATGSFDGVLSVDANRAFMNLPLFFLPVEASDNIERSLTIVRIRYGIPRLTLSMEPRRTLYSLMSVAGAQQATDLANSKDGINETIAALQYYDKNGLGGALTFAASKIAARPALVRNPWAAQLIKSGAQLTEGLIGKTKIGGAVQGVTNNLAKGNAVGAGQAVGQLVGAVKARRATPEGQKRIAQRQLNRANRRAARR